MSKSSIFKRPFIIVLIIACLMILSGTFLAIHYESSLSITGKRAWLELRQLLDREPQADVLLSVLFDRQDHSLSCEAAGLKMVLAYRGIKVSEDQLLADIGIDDTPKHTVAGQVIWGDPYKAFVGNVDGKMMQDGYGVYWGPIAAAANKYLKAKVITGGTASQIAGYLSDGNPVIAWSYLGSGKTYEWVTPGGRSIKGIYSEHPVVVRGFKGTEDEPEGFFVIDPIYGYKYLTISDFMAKWDVFQRSGVVIY